MMRRAFFLTVLTGACVTAAAYRGGEESAREESSQVGVEKINESLQGTPTTQTNYADQERGETSDYERVNGDQTWHKEQPNQQQHHHQHQLQHQRSQGFAHPEEFSNQNTDPQLDDNFNQQKDLLQDQYQQFRHQKNINPYDYHQNLPKILQEEHLERIKTITVTNKIPKSFELQFEKNVPYEVKVPVDRPFPVYVPQPYPIFLEKKIPYEIDIPIPRPFSIEKNNPFDFAVPFQKPYKIPIEKPFPIDIEKPFPVYYEKNNPIVYEKHLPYPGQFPIEKPLPVPVEPEKQVPYPVEKFVQFPVKVAEENPVLYSVENPIPYQGENKMTYPVIKDQYLVPYEEQRKEGNKPAEKRPAVDDVPQTGGQAQAPGEQKHQGDEVVTVVSQMVEVGRNQEHSNPQSYRPGAQEGYGDTGENKPSKLQLQDQGKKKVSDEKRSVGRSYSHNSMHSNGKKISYSTTIDHYLPKV